MGRRDLQTADLFEVPQPAKSVPGAQDYRPIIAGLVSEMLADIAHEKDRHQVAAEMSRLTGREITKNMLDGYSSEARETFNIPAALMPVLEFVCHCHRYSHWEAEVRGGKLLIGRETLNAELGRLEKMRDDAATAIRRIKTQMGEKP